MKVYIEENPTAFVAEDNVQVVGFNMETEEEAKKAASATLSHMPEDLDDHVVKILTQTLRASTKNTLSRDWTEKFSEFPGVRVLVPIEYDISEEELLKCGNFIKDEITSN